MIWISLVIFNNHGVIPAAIILMLNIWLAPISMRHFLVIVGISSIGIFVDYVLIMKNVLVFNTGFVPLWLIVLWLGFSFSLSFGFKFLEKLPLIAKIIIGIFSGTVSYYIGYTFGSVNFSYSLELTGLTLALIWSFLLPLFIYISMSFRH